MTLLTRAPVRCSDSASLHDLLCNQDYTLDIAKLLITYALRDQASHRYTYVADTAMTLLTRAPVRCSDSPSLHDLLCNQDCTLDIAKFLITYALRDQASLKDGNGNLPLHIVASRYSDNDIMYGKVITSLLELYPAACQISNSEGTLPLQLMDRSEKLWSSMIMVFLQHPAAVLDLELNHVARCALLAKVGSEEKPDALFRLLQDAPVFLLQEQRSA